MKIMQGELFLASSKSFLILSAPIPTNISSKWDPVIEINLTLDSPAIALAIRVFPVPGLPHNNTP